MFRVIYEIHRAEDLTREEFAERWARHRPFIRALPRIRSYNQSLVDRSENGLAPEMDGFSILDFDSEADFRAADASPEMQAAHDDAATLVSHVSSYYVTPTQVV